MIRCYAAILSIVFFALTTEGAQARVATLQVTNLTSRCAAFLVFAATDTASEMYQLRYQKPRVVKPGKSAVLSAMKGRLPAMHLLVRTMIAPGARCDRYTGIAQRAFASPRAALEVPTFRLVPAAGQFELLGPGA